MFTVWCFACLVCFCIVCCLACFSRVLGMFIVCFVLRLLVVLVGMRVVCSRFAVDSVWLCRVAVLAGISLVLVFIWFVVFCFGWLFRFMFATYYARGGWRLGIVLLCVLFVIYYVFSFGWVWVFVCCFDSWLF